MYLLLLTLGLGAIATVFVRRTVGLWFTPCSWYWTGWVLGIGAASFASWRGEIPAVTPLADELIKGLHFGAFVGIVLGTIVYRFAAIVSNRDSVRSGRELNLPRSVFRAVILVSVTIGMLALFVRVRGVSGSGTLTLLGIRNAFLEDRFSALPRLYSHMAIAFGFIPILLGWRDGRREKIQIKQLLLLWASGIPAGLSTAGRGWILGPFPAYFAAYIIAQDGPQALQKFLKLTRIALPLVAACMVLFVALGTIRLGRLRVVDSEVTESRSTKSMDLMTPVAYYFGVPISAVGPFADFALSQERTHGLLLFPWAGSQLVRLRIVKEDPYTAFVTGSREHVSETEAVLSSSHASIIPNIVGDFGADSLPIVSTILMFIFQVAGLAGRRGGLVGQYVAVTCCLSGAFWLFQDSMFGVSATVLGFMWTVLAALLLGRAGVQRRGASAGKVQVSRGAEEERILVRDHMIGPPSRFRYLE